VNVLNVSENVNKIQDDLCYTSIYTYICIYTHTHTHTHIHAYGTFLNVHMHACAYAHANARAHTHVYIHLCIHLQTWARFYKEIETINIETIIHPRAVIILGLRAFEGREAYSCTLAKVQTSASQFSSYIDHYFNWPPTYSPIRGTRRTSINRAE
jgi:hypothetical protein